MDGQWSAVRLLPKKYKYKINNVKILAKSDVLEEQAYFHIWHLAYFEVTKMQKEDWASSAAVLSFVEKERSWEKKGNNCQAQITTNCSNVPTNISWRMRYHGRRGLCYKDRDEGDDSCRSNWIMIITMRWPALMRENSSRNKTEIFWTLLKCLFPIKGEACLYCQIDSQTWGWRMDQYIGEAKHNDVWNFQEVDNGHQIVPT